MRFAMAAVCVLVGILPLQGQTKPHKEVMLQTTKSWDGKPYSYPAGTPELSVVRITIPAHTALQWHKHPVPNVVYVAAGTLTLERKDGKTVVVKTGDVLPELLNEVHRGVAGDSDVVLISFYAGAVGVPVAVDAPVATK